MVFSGVPVYLDPPHWQQQDQQLGLGGAENLLLPTTVAATTTAPSGGLIRPPLMLERARVGTAQPPEPSLKCPRCESTNTKFCYYNNYSKTQPRHFCKTCRRYWTRGGALRNVPVGGGCRRNKRNKNNTRSSPITDQGVAAAGAAASSGGAITLPSTTGGAIQALGLDQHQNPVPPQHFPFLPTIHQFSDFTGSDLGLPFAGMHPLRSDRLGNISGGGGGGGMNYSPGQSSSSQWRLQQQGQHFPIGFGQTDSMTGLEPTPSPSQGLFPFHQEGMEQQYMAGGQLRAKPPPVSDLGSIKSEENQNLPRQFLGLQSGCDQYWGSNAWADFSGFSSSTSPHL